MTKTEAITIIERFLNQFRKISYESLVEKIGKQKTFEETTEKGEDYRIEIDFFFDGHEETNLRVVAMISYSFWTDFSPISTDFIMHPSGNFVGE